MRHTCVSRAQPRAFFKGAALSAIIPLSLMMASTATRSHSFYSWECCSDRDCWPTGSDHDSREPNPTYTPAGWRLHDGSVIPFTKTRPSPDGRFHICRQGAQVSGPVIQPHGKPTCVWAPVNGF